MFATFQLIFIGNLSEEVLIFFISCVSDMSRCFARRGGGGVGPASWYLGRTQILIYMIYMVINIIFDNFEINPLIRTEVRKTGG